MLRLRYLAAVLCVSTPFVVACSDDMIDDPGDGGAGGEAGAEPLAGSGGDAGGGGDAGSGGDCATGTGKLVLAVSGLPEGVAPEVLIDGPGDDNDLLADEAELTFEDMGSGAYTVTASRVFDADPVVRSVFEPTVTMPDFTLCGGDEHTISVSYEKIPTSNKLWMTTGRDDELAGFSSFAIADSGITDATVAISGPAGKAVAFDRDGNLWTFGPTTEDAHLTRFPAAELGDGGTRTPDIEINVLDVPCGPQMRSLAFDAEGNLWLSVCGGEVHGIVAADLTTSGDKTAEIVLAGDDDANEGLAFDADGNLWVADGPRILRYDAATLASSTADADALLTPKDGVGGFAVNFLAFDADGNLWGNDFGANALFRISAEDLAATGAADVQTSVSITIGVDALLNQMAFDDGGGLWLGLGEDAMAGTGAVGRLTPGQLAIATNAGAPTTPEVIIDSQSIGAGLPVAFFPAAKGLPLYHALPTE